MSKWNELLLDVNYMKSYHQKLSKIVSIDMSEFGFTNREIMKKAVMARYYLDCLLLNGDSLTDKWGQSVVLNFGEIVFRGSEEECYEWIIDRIGKGFLEMNYIFPGDPKYDWNKYFKKFQKTS